MIPETKAEMLDMYESGTSLNVGDAITVPYNATDPDGDAITNPVAGA